MILLENEKNVINGLVDSIRHITKINIFDFDGTIFKSPVPNGKIWDSKTFGKLMADSSRGGLGWFQHTITLDNKYIKDSTFNEDVVSDVRKSMADPSCATILLTGRDTSFTSRIRDIVSSIGLVFDDFGLKPEPKVGEVRETTMNFKKRFIKEMIEKYGADKVEMWEDRQKHVIAFREYLTALGVNSGVNFIDRPETHMNSDLEREVVNYLSSKNASFAPVNESVTLDKTATYWGVKLSSESYDDLISAVGSFVPEGWKLYAHHMTMLFGRNKNEAVEKYLADHLGETVELTAIELGISPDAIAVKINSSVPSDNKIPHVTIATPQNGKAVKSNMITDWTRLNKSIKLSGIVSAFR